MLSRAFAGLLLLLVFRGEAQEPRVHTRSSSSGLNQLVLDAVGRMPAGGRYSTSSQANQRLGASIRIDSRGLALTPEVAQPSYCSGATFLVFVAAVDALIRRGTITAETPVLQSLLVRGQRDGEGIWGRWNANGPGTARLFAEAGLGRNFTDWSEARPGDFMKIWWNNEVGQRERGHSVIFLGAEGDEVLFWSSNVPSGYGRRTVPRSQVKWAVFSRFEHPEALRQLATLPKRDDYLASMLTRPSSRAEVAAKCGFRE